MSVYPLHDLPIAQPVQNYLFNKIPMINLLYISFSALPEIQQFPYLHRRESCFLTSTPQPNLWHLYPIYHVPNGMTIIAETHPVFIFFLLFHALRCITIHHNCIIFNYFFYLCSFFNNIHKNMHKFTLAIYVVLLYIVLEINAACCYLDDGLHIESTCITISLLI